MGITSYAQIGITASVDQLSNIRFLKGRMGSRIGVDKPVASRWVLRGSLGWHFSRRSSVIGLAGIDTTLARSNVAARERYDLYDISLGAQRYLSGDWKTGGWYAGASVLIGIGIYDRQVDDFDRDRYRIVFYDYEREERSTMWGLPISFGYHWGKFDRLHVLTEVSLMPVLVYYNNGEFDSGGFMKTLSIGFRYWISHTNSDRRNDEHE